ncbi:uncharacterized protein LOC113860861 [Abrus precatorius]|uniref:Mitochondrial import inner membrane translocase subunit TIM50 n=1 Tax=Abrus precatorius TaxID=3816 RepID=A0A8B8KZ50_ABRPR|nr:uncharacterized protein LOC113860861 [Abrus precatorius]
MAGKIKSSSYGKHILYSDSEDDYEAQDTETELNLPLEKLNLGPRKKLLVLNINGLLLSRFHRREKERIPKFRAADHYYRSYLVFKRPFSEEFMKFCLERFEVGIWSSAIGHNIDITLDYAIGALKKKMLFVWDQRRCTDTGFKSLEKSNKPLFFKELKKVFDNGTKGGPYSASNTLLIDDKPYKAFLNPPNTAIFPKSYDPDENADRVLDPKGALCLYLKGVAESHDIQSYVKNNPFGQPEISTDHPDWKFYSLVKATVGTARALILPSSK